MHDLKRRLKNISAFQEKRPLLRKEDRESFVGGQNRCVGFNLREVGVGGKVERNIRSYPEFDGDSGIGLQRFVYKAAWILQRRVLGDFRGEQRWYSLAGFRKS